MSDFLLILKQRIIDPIQNFIVVAITLLLLTIIGFIGKRIKDDLLKSFFDQPLKCFFDRLHEDVFVPISYAFKCDSYVKKLKEQKEELKKIFVSETDELIKLWLSSQINKAEALIQRKEEAKMKKCLFGLCPNLKSRYQLSKEADEKASAIDELRNQGIDALKSSNLYMIGVYGLRTRKLGRSKHLDDELKELLRGCEDLFLREVIKMKNGLYDLNEEGFPKLKHLYIQDNIAIRHIIDSTIRVSCDAFPILETLILEYLPSLEEICNGRLGTESFRKLRTLKIIRCRKLKKLFSFSTAKNLLQLQEMYVSNCDNLEAVIAEESEDGSSETETQMVLFCNLTILEVKKCKSLKYIFKTSTVEDFEAEERTDKIVFSKLDILELRGLPNLIRFSNSYFIESQSLREMIISSYPISTNFFIDGISNNNSSNDVRSLFNEMVCPNLERLELEGNKTIEIRDEVYGDLGEELFLLDHKTAVRLECLELHRMNYLKYIWKEGSFVPSENLKTLIVSHCDSMIKIAPSSISFKNLTTMHISWCQKLKNLVTLSTAKTMEHLMELSVECCEMMTEIVADNGDDDAEHEIIFKQLKSLELIHLSYLNSFCSRNNCTFHFPSLEELLIDDCNELLMAILSHGNLIMPKLEGIRSNKFSDQKHWEGNLNATIASMLPKQATLNIRSSSSSKAISRIRLQSMQNIRSINVIDSDNVQVVFDLEAMSIDSLLPKLRELRLIDLPMLIQLWNRDPVKILDFKKLRLLELQNCGHLRYVFTPSVASCLIQLRQIEVNNCKVIKTIIQAEEEEERVALANQMILPSLESVALKCLPTLSSLYSEIGILERPSLKKITIIDCPNLKDFISSLSRTQNIADDEGREQIQEIHQVYPNLEILELQGINTIWEHGRLKILMPSSVCFKNLTNFKVSKCDEMINLITVSTAKSLVLLSKMIISQCKMMQEVVGVESDGSEDVIGFNQLECLELDDLPSLTSFCSGNYVFNFPNLVEVTITKCPNMKAFAQQVFTPRLCLVRGSYCWPEDNYYWGDSLNNAIQQLFMKGNSNTPSVE